MKLSLVHRKLFTSLSLLFLLTVFSHAESKTAGGFSIAPPPLGYAGYYGTESLKRHRIDLAYQYYDLDVSEVLGGSVYLNSRIVGGSRGSVSLQYGGYQFITQDFSDGEDSYHTRFIGPLGGVLAHIPAGSALISPFVSAKHLWGEADSGNISFDFTTLGYGFDIVWSGFSLSGIMQAATQYSNKVYTISMGFAF